MPSDRVFLISFTRQFRSPMKPIHYLLSATFFMAQIAFCQSTFQKSIGKPGNDYTLRTIKTDDGFLLSGKSGSDMLLVQIDHNGDTLWTRTYSSSGSLNGSWVQRMEDNGFVIVGDGTVAQGAGVNDVMVIRTDGNGNEQWAKVYGTPNTDYGTAIAVAADGIYIGGANLITTNAADALIIKTDLQGDTLWTRTFGGVADENINAIEVTSDGGCIIAGTTTSFSGTANAAMVVKWSAAGDIEWSGIYSNGGNSYGFGITSAGENDGYIITGVTDGEGEGGYDMLQMKVNEDMSVAWSKTFGGSGFDSGVSSLPLNSGAIITLGQSYSFGVESDLFLVQTSNSGVLDWSMAYGGDGYEFGETVLALSDGFLITGAEESFGNDRALYLVKTDLTGHSNCQEQTCLPISHEANMVLTEVDPIVHRGLHFATTNVVSHRGTDVYEFCEAIHVQDDALVNYEIYPNPFNESITLRGTSVGVKFLINDIAGKQVLAGSLQSDVSTINTSTLPVGVYVMSLVEKNEVKNWKLVKE